MASVIDIYNFAKQGAEDGKQRGLAALYGKAYNAPRQQRQEFIGKMAMTDPDAAVAANKSFNAQDEDIQGQIMQRAGMVASLYKTNPQMAQAAYQGLPELAARGGFGQVPGQLDDKVAAALEQMVIAGQTPKEAPTSVQEYQYAQQNPGYVDYRRQIAEASARPQYGNINGTPIQYGPNGYTPVGPAGQQQAPGVGQPMPQGGGGKMVLDDALSNAVMQQESGGNPNAVSSAGARGLMQLMPGTQRDPGFGVQPASDDSPQENVRVGKDYLQAMLQRYNGNQQLALAAYNAGPGRVDQALKGAGGNPQAAIARLPAETRAYVPGVERRMGGGQQVAQNDIYSRDTPPIEMNAEIKGMWPGLSPAQRKAAVENKAGLTQDNKPSELERKIAMARDMGATPAELKQMVIGREGAAAGAKPMPIGAVREDMAIEDALGVSENVFRIAQKHLSRIAAGELEMGPMAAAGAAMRTKLNNTNANDVKYNELVADRTKIVNDSLILNKGVQTEGDAQRAVTAMMNANDIKTTVAALKRLVEVNKRGVALQQRKRQLLRANYGRQAEQQAPQPAAGGVLRWNPQTQDFE